MASVLLANRAPTLKASVCGHTALAVYKATVPAALYGRSTSLVGGGVLLINTSQCVPVVFRVVLADQTSFSVRWDASVCSSEKAILLLQVILLFIGMWYSIMRPVSL